ncbi:MAG: PAS domain-containing protein [Methanomicrobiales archaeon]
MVVGNGTGPRIADNPEIGAEDLAPETISQLLRAIINNANIWFAVIDPGTRVVIWNTAAEEISGYSKDEVIGRSDIWKQIYPDPAYRRKIFDRISDIISSEKFLENFETTILTRSGERRHILWNTNPLKDTDGNLIGYVVIGRDVTELACAIDELEAREQLFSGVMSAAQDAIVILDKDAEVVYWNPAAEQISGYTEEEIRGRTVYTLFPEERRQDFAGIFDAFREESMGAEAEPFEMPVHTREGDEIPVEVSASSTLIQGEWRAICIVRDISERKKAEKELQKKEKKYRQLFNNAADSIFLYGVHEDGTPGRFLEVNDTACKNLGYTRDELLRMTVADIDSPESAKNAPRVIDQLRKRGRVTFEGYHVRKDGSVFPVEMASHIFTLEDEPVVLSISRDITERKKAETDQLFLANIVKSSSDAIIGLDLEGYIRSWNPAAEEIYEYSAEEAIGSHISIVVPEDRQKEEIGRELELIRNGERLDHYETVRLNKSGEKVYIDLSVSPIREPSGEITGASVIARDITDQKEMQRRILGFITEAAMRLKTPVEVVQDNLIDLRAEVENEVVCCDDVLLLLQIQIKNIEQIIYNLRELNQAIVGLFEQMPEAEREFLVR